MDLLNEMIFKKGTVTFFKYFRSNFPKWRLHLTADIRLSKTFFDYHKNVKPCKDLQICQIKVFAEISRGVFRGSKNVGLHTEIFTKNLHSVQFVSGQHSRRRR